MHSYAYSSRLFSDPWKKYIPFGLSCNLTAHVHKKLQNKTMPLNSQVMTTEYQTWNPYFPFRLLGPKDLSAQALPLPGIRSQNPSQQAAVQQSLDSAVLAGRQW